MEEIVQFNEIEERIIMLRNIPSILDSDVAYLYGVETKRINEAVSNNPEKFPEGYIFSIQSVERQELVENFGRFANLKHSTSTKAFTEKGLYMIATILKGEKARATTFKIIETFARIRELSRIVNQLPQMKDKTKQKSLAKRGGEIISEMFDNDLELTDSETVIELNLAAFKIKHTVKKGKKS